MPDRPSWDPFTPDGIREATAKILTGLNYRLFFEGATRRTLIETYRKLAVLARKHPNDNDAWRSHVRDLVSTGDLQDRRMRQWLIGLTMKTARNLGVATDDYLAVFDEVMTDIEAAVSSDTEEREMALLLWAGTATLTIRGSRKSKIGKALERAIARAALAIIGLREGGDDFKLGEFRLNVGADREVDRETDAEVRTPRASLRVEVGLIGVGNSEVIGDKVGRMSRNDVILMDMIPAKSAAWQTAVNRGVVLIQLRNNHPVEELRRHLAGFYVPVRTEPITPEQVERYVLQMPLSAFSQS